MEQPTNEGTAFDARVDRSVNATPSNRKMKQILKREEPTAQIPAVLAKEDSAGAKRRGTRRNI